MGLKVMYTPEVSCVDYVGQTFKRQPSVQKQKWFTQSMKTYFKKWHSWTAYACVALARPMGIGLTWIHSQITKRK